MKLPVMLFWTAVCRCSWRSCCVVARAWPIPHRPCVGSHYVDGRERHESVTE